jgi:hypothetical protein
MIPISLSINGLREVKQIYPITAWTGILNTFRRNKLALIWEGELG